MKYLQMKLKRLKNDFRIYPVAILLNVVVLTMVTRVDQIDPRIPLNYRGDGIEWLAKTKGHIYNDKKQNLFAPFEIEWKSGAAREILVFPFQKFRVQTIKILSLFTGDPALATNLFFLLTFILTPAAAVFVLRYYRIDPVICVLCALAFNFLPYHFMRGVSHLEMSSYFYIPFFVLIMLWTWGAAPLP